MRTRDAPAGRRPCRLCPVFGRAQDFGTQLELEVMAPLNRPFPRFIAESPHELEPHGRWRTMLEELFRSACKSIEGEDDLGEVGEIVWFPDRTYGVRTFVPARAPTEAGPEVFGYVSFTRSDDSPQPTDFIARADYTVETATGADWKLDLNDEVIARWRGPAESSGDLTASGVRRSCRAPSP